MKLVCRFLFLTIFTSVLNAPAAPQALRNYFELSDRVARSAAPTSQIPQLVAEGFTDVVILRPDARNQVAIEAARWQAAGVTDGHIHHVPLDWKGSLGRGETCQLFIQALKILVKIDNSRGNAKILFHCTAGEDRTGAIAGLFQMLQHSTPRNSISVEQVFGEELCARGYEAGNPNKPRQVVGLIRQHLTPVFLSLAALIEQGTLTSRNLDESVCDSMATPPISSAAGTQNFYCR